MIDSIVAKGPSHVASLAAWMMRQEAWILGLLGILSIALLWQVGSMMLTDTTFISNPHQVALAAVDQFRSGQLVNDLITSMGELGPGFFAATMIGVPLGMAMGRYRVVEYLMDPYLWFFYSAPIIAFYPLLIMWLGLGSKTIIALTFLFAVFPIIANTVTGVREVDSVLVRAARAFGGNELQIFALVVFPASIPGIMAGLRLGIGRALIGTIVGEFFGANAGLGFRIAVYGTEMRIGPMFVPVITVMIIGVGLLQFLRWLESFVETWRR